MQDRFTGMWHDLRRLLDGVVTAGDREEFLDACLDTLVTHYGAECGVIFGSRAGQPPAVIAARGPGRDLTGEEREEISKTVVRRAEQTGECVVWVSEKLGQTESMEALKVTAALAAPLRAFSGDLHGVLYLDFRDALVELDDTSVEFLRAAAALVSVVLEQSRRLQVAREDLRQARALGGGLAAMPSLDELLWAPSMATMRSEVESALHGESCILVLGESGTGKTALARAIAEAGDRQPIVRAVLGASDDLNTITSELFGHERGAFSGAIARRVGLVELADGGTLILDEILNLPPHAQQLLLDFTQFGSYRPLGYTGAQPKHVKVRLIAATNGDLEAAVRAGRFRLDLYYRIAAVVLKLPPLRARREEIPLLAESHLARIDPERTWSLSVGARRLLLAPDIAWEGNIRQLEAMVSRARDRALARDPGAVTIQAAHFDPLAFGTAALPLSESPAEPPQGAGESSDLATALRDKEREMVENALKTHGGNILAAARALGVSRGLLYRKIAKYGINA